MLTERILWLVGLALTPALAVQGYNEYALPTPRDAAVRSDTMATARTVTDDFGQLAETVRQAPSFAAQDLAVRAMVHRRRPRSSPSSSTRGATPAGFSRFIEATHLRPNGWTANSTA